MMCVKDPGRGGFSEIMADALCCHATDLGRLRASRSITNPRVRATENHVWYCTSSLLSLARGSTH